MDPIQIHWKLGIAPAIAPSRSTLTIRGLLNGKAHWNHRRRRDGHPDSYRSGRAGVGVVSNLGRGVMDEFVNPESGEMVNKKGVPLRGWDTVKKNYAKAGGTNKAKAPLRRLDREREAL